MSGPSISSKRPPVTYVLHRLASTALFVLLVVVLGLGIGGKGPADTLHRGTDRVTTWVEERTSLEKIR